MCVTAELGSAEADMLRLRFTVKSSTKKNMIQRVVSSDKSQPDTLCFHSDDAFSVKKNKQWCSLPGSCIFTLLKSTCDAPGVNLHTDFKTRVLLRSRERSADTLQMLLL